MNEVAKIGVGDCSICTIDSVFDGQFFLAFLSPSSQIPNTVSFLC